MSPSLCRSWAHLSQGVPPLKEIRVAMSEMDVPFFLFLVFTGCRVGFELLVHCKFLLGLTLLMWMFFASLLRSVLSPALHNFYPKGRTNLVDWVVQLQTLLIASLHKSSMELYKGLHLP